MLLPVTAAFVPMIGVALVKLSLAGRANAAGVSFKVISIMAINKKAAGSIFCRMGRKRDVVTGKG
jgi:hypothetical protein